MFKKKIYPAVYLKSVLLIFLLSFLILVSIFCLWVLINIPFSWKSIIFGVLALNGPTIIIFIVTAKIIITDDKIIKKSIFGSKYLTIKEIKSIGVYEQMDKYGSFLLQKKDIDNQVQKLQIHIHISELLDYNPNSFKRYKGLRFGFRKDLYDEIMELVKTNEVIKDYNE